MAGPWVDRCVLNSIRSDIPKLGTGLRQGVGTGDVPGNDHQNPANSFKVN